MSSIHKIERGGFILKIGFIGAGKVASALGKYFTDKHLQLVGYYNHHLDAAIWAADYTNSHYFASMQELVAQCDIIFLAVTDHAIADVWHRLRQLPLKDKHICHLSGALSSAVFDDIRTHQAYGYSVHPLYAFHAKEMDTSTFSGIHLTIEGDSEHLKQVCTLFTSLGHPVATISAENKVQYHAASVMASNLVIGLANMAQSLFQQSGLDEQFSQRVWHQLFLNNAKNMCEVGLSHALTGPLERGDWLTIKKHLACLGADEKCVYTHLSLALLGLAKQKNPTRDYQLIEQELLNEK